MKFLIYALLAIGLWGIITPLLLYPIALFSLSRFRPRRPTGAATPSATLVISAYNESTVIGEKIANALSQDYPAHLLDIIVISDASDDRTDDVVKRLCSDRIRLFRQETRLGKSAGLTRFCQEARGEILIFTDANSIFQVDATANLLRDFDDDKVGYTVGRQLYHDYDEHSSATSEKFYWSLELMLKQWESRVSSVVGADGAIFAIRKSLFEPMLAEDINDFLLPLKAVVKGYKGVFESEAVCYERAAPDFESEFRRKFRIVNRSLLAVAKVPQALNPFRVGVFALQVLCHKVLRWLSPVFLGLTFLSASVLIFIDPTPFIFLLHLTMVAGCCLAMLHFLPFFRRWPIVSLSYYYLMVNVAALVGITMLLMGRSISIWQPQR